MGKNVLKTLKETFRKLAISPLQRQIEKTMQDMHPEAASLMEQLGHPRLHSQIKRNGKQCYAEGNSIHLITNEKAAVETEAEMVYAAMVDMAEKKGLGNDVLAAERRDINSRIYTDWQDDCTRFKLSDLNHGATGQNAKLLRACIKFLEEADLPQCNTVAELLRDNDMTVNLRPAQNSALSGSFSPDSKELTLFYDPEMDEADIIGKLCLNIVHETCHYDQDRKGIMADSMGDVNAYREIFHLNELQAHTAQYKTALQLLMKSSHYPDFAEGKTDIEALTEKLGTSAQLQDRICFQHLCQSRVGTTILSNLQQHSLYGDKPHIAHAETMVKEALCRGEITSLTESGAEYDTNSLSRMQRYAHSHISVMNYSVARGGGMDFDTAVAKHFDAPLGLDKTGNTVPFANTKLSFVSPVTKRDISVGAIEMLWERAGFEQNGLKNLGQASEAVLAKTAPTAPRQVQKTGSRFSAGSG
ncbi:MAG: hypothetical protein EP349_02065 [Alphaproteobacteria bacterium]|nr:MAG: hypothetical protein EP349_02065 [Alphaproteobacteria bacterium]